MRPPTYPHTNRGVPVAFTVLTEAQPRRSFPAQASKPPQRPRSRARPSASLTTAARGRYRAHAGLALPATATAATCPRPAPVPPGVALPEAPMENGGLRGGGGERGGAEQTSGDLRAGGAALHPLPAAAMAAGWRVVVLVLALGAAVRGGLGPVTCGSVVKLLNLRHNVRLHSHDVRYGSGSGQQSVTGVSAADDGNSYWRVRGRTAAVCERGTPVRCGQAIRLTHLGTGRNLHSHHFASPLSGNQEVSAFGEAGEGDYLDDWTVVCSGTYWVRDGEVRFQHTSTDVFLSVTGEQYGRPIHGQKEVHGMAASSQNNYWKVMEGIFMKPSEVFKAEQYHAEL
ncbi:stromal cell-derived factor 2 [Indicator indicator]|uniref:stromal cell-derived factor 2 n=1 Tax=Indicator indicator TaxID=1002788 RepID=UPI0023DECC37|nr:stromal cell-derived factor 2 [Indicator indicator]